VIALVLLALFGAACLLLIVDGLLRRGGIFEFSFLAGCGLFGFLFTQAVGVVRNPGMVPEAGVIKGLVMCCLCAFAVYLGWKAPVRAKRAAPRRFPFSLKWMHRVGIACIIVGLIGFLSLASLSGGVVAHYSTRGSYSLHWAGLPVVYWFFTVYLYLGFVLVALAALRLRSWLLLLPAAIPLAVVMANAVLLGRRNELALLVVITAGVLFFSRDFAPPRWLAVSLAPLAMAAMFILPATRKYSQIGGDWDQLQQVSVSDIMGGVFTGVDGEFWSMCYLMEITDTEGRFQFGGGFYNEFVKVFVPKLLVGDTLKGKLFLDLPSAITENNRLGWVIPPGMVRSGPYSVFEQFWYFGAACFYFLARWLKGHWVRARAGDFWSQVVYCISATAAVSAVTNDVYAIYLPLFMFVIPLAAFTRWRGSMHALAQPYGYAMPGRDSRFVPQSSSAVKAALHTTRKGSEGLRL
jgi:hypothetical protein